MARQLGWFRLYEQDGQAGRLGVDDLVLHRGNDEEPRHGRTSAGFSADP